MWEFLKWFYGDVNNVVEFLAASSGYLCIPTFKPAQEIVFAKIAELYPDLNLSVLTDTVNVESACPVWMRYNPNWNEVNTIIGNEIIDPISTGDKTAEEVMTDESIIQSINDVLNEEV